MKATLSTITLALLLACLSATLTTAAPTTSPSELSKRDQAFTPSISAQAPPKDSKAFSKVLKAKHPLNILLNNDDSWAAANIRAAYYALKAAGHNVVMVAPAGPQSGKGGTIVLPTNATLTTEGAFNALPPNAPYAGYDPADPNLHWFNGTPAAVTFWALDQVKPFNGNIDLVVTGPNFGQNLGPLLYTLSGTIGGAYAAVEKGYPAMAFSAFNSTQAGFNLIDFSNPDQEYLVVGRHVSDFVTAYADKVKSSKGSKARLIPQGLGFNVNFSPVSKGCDRPKWTHTRISGGAFVDQLSINSTTNLPTYENQAPAEGTGINTCRGGHCRLPGETTVVGEKDSKACLAAVSIFNVDYTATVAIDEVNPGLNGAVSYLNDNKV